MTSTDQSAAADLGGRRGGDKPGELLTGLQVAEILGISERQVRRLRRDGLLDSAKGIKGRTPRSAVDAYLRGETTSNSAAPVAGTTEAAERTGH